MGLEFALVHQASHEAYHLGKWCHGLRKDGTDWRTRMPASREEVRAFFESFYEEEPELVEPTTDDVWLFIEKHPGCRLVSEHDDVSWSSTTWPPDPDRVRAWGEENCFYTIASRYDVRPRAASRQACDPKREP